MMISTAILMEIGADQTSVRPASTDREAADGASFAKSLDERLGGTVKISQDEHSGHVSTVLQSSKEETLAKTANKAFAVLSEVKGKAIASGVGLEHADTAGEPASGKIVPQHKAPVLRSHAKNMSEDSEIEDVQSSVDAEPMPEGSSVPQNEKESSFKNDAFLSRVNAEDRLVSPRGEILVQTEATKTASTSETLSTEKNAKSSPGKVAPLLMQSVAVAPHPVAVTAGPAATTVVQGSDHFSMKHTIEAPITPAVAASTVPKAEPSSTPDGNSGGVSLVGKGFLAEIIPTKDNLVQKDISGKVSPGADVETVSPAVIDASESAKRGVGVEKLLPTGTPANGGSDWRLENMSGFAVTAAHAMAGNGAVGSEMVVPGHVSADAAVMKLGVPGETGGHVADSQMGEQGSSGSVGGSHDNLPQMLIATPTALEVGIQNGTHGWLKVRAEMTDNGAVNASVSASSTTGEEMLHRELPSLTAYLQAEKVTVNTVVVHATAIESRGSAAGTDSGSSGQTQYGGDDGRRDHKGVTETFLDGADEVASHENLNVFDENGALPLATYVGGGSWLSIRA
ncbi:hypothetical protein [Tunturiibacter lichenicola]|uniref:hypothetical protein n=1 Tax=Tunturiibacter lichenicola TaxID=2051959 RepID=UPI003D9B7E07